MAASDWKTHPVVVLGGSFIAGATAALTIAVPLYNTMQQNACDAKVKQVEDRYAQDKNDILNIRALKDKNTALEGALSNAVTELDALSGQHPFRKGSYYPVGFESIRIGTSLDEIRHLQPDVDIKRSGTLAYAYFKNGFIRELQMDTESDKIISIVYYVEDSEFGSQHLLSAATTAFGQPKDKSQDAHGKMHYSWDVDGKTVTVYGNQYSIFF